MECIKNYKFKKILNFSFSNSVGFSGNVELYTCKTVQPIYCFLY